MVNRSDDTLDPASKYICSGTFSFFIYNSLARWFLEQNLVLISPSHRPSEPSNAAAGSYLASQPLQESETPFHVQKMAMYEETISQLWHELKTAADVLKESARLLHHEPTMENIQLIQVAQMGLHKEIRELRARVRVQHSKIGATDILNAEQNPYEY